MKVLNLVYTDKSDIKYTISKFPDGQQNITITGQRDLVRVGNGHPKDDHWAETTIPLQVGKIQIKSRLNNWLDLELIVASVASLRELGVKEIHLYTPYILGARSDRKFEDGGNNYLKDVICPVLNSLELDSITCLDPHSHVLEGCLKQFKSVSNKSLVFWSLTDLYKNKSELSHILIAPDAGASHKIYKLAEQIGYKEDIVTCRKERDTEGNLTLTYVPFSMAKCRNKDFIIIDDICDGGATFINIGKAIKSRFEIYDKSNFNSKLYLIITHGIFSKGFDELSKYFDGIYCTNSYSDTPACTSKMSVNEIKAIHKVKQLNVF